MMAEARDMKRRARNVLETLLSCAGSENVVEPEGGGRRAGDGGRRYETEQETGAVEDRRSGKEHRSRCDYNYT
jgi:hypothetical protein